MTDQPFNEKPTDLPVQSGDAPIPAVYWRPAAAPWGIVLSCHGGSGHKMSAGNLLIARACAARGLAVLAIDGPVHGDRRADKSILPADAIASYREAWRNGVGRTSMAGDMSAAIDAMLAIKEFQGLPVGYVGVSMGTGYGIPFLALERRIAAAVIGLWGQSYPASEHLWDYAKKIECPVWFTQQWNDTKFEHKSMLDIFDAVGAKDKRLVAYPGDHLELEGERLEDAVDFLVRRMASSIGRPVPHDAVVPGAVGAPLRAAAWPL